jgi:hypothetical protein
MGREDEIRLIAYQIWEEEGCLVGRDCEHWFRAETIWEEQKQQAAASSARTVVKPVKQNAEVKATKKRAK